MSAFTARQLGKTGLQVSPLGIGGGHAIHAVDLLYAFERGINYFFFSSDLHHFHYQNSVPALRKLCRAGSSIRDTVVLATVSYIHDPEKLTGIICDQLAELGTDYIDIFHWGWITDRTDFAPLVQAARQLKSGGAIAQSILRWQMIQRQAQQVAERLLRQGLVRYIGASFHSRQAARCWMDDLDVLMLRYNIAHTGVERDIFPVLTGEQARDPGIVVFNVAHAGTNFFHVPPPGYPPGLYVPSIPDLYRFALSNPGVDVVLTGVGNREELDQALGALEQGPLSEDECTFLREYGAIYARRLLRATSNTEFYTPPSSSLPV